MRRRRRLGQWGENRIRMNFARRRIPTINREFWRGWAAGPRDAGRNARAPQSGSESEVVFEGGLVRGARVSQACFHRGQGR